MSLDLEAPARQAAARSRQRGEAKPAADGLAAASVTCAMHYLVVVWGRQYIDTLLNITLPSQITAGNLGGLQQPEAALYRIFTTPDDAERIRSSPVVHELARIAQLDIQLFELPAHDKHGLVASLQRRAAADARAAGAGIVFLAPDIVVADGSFVALERLVRAGKTAVMLAAPRLYMPTFASALRLRYLEPASGAIRVLPRDLVALSLKHLHPVTKALFWGRPWFSNWPSILLWKIGKEAMLARYWHMHPLFVRADLLAGDFLEQSQSTIDGDLLMSVEGRVDSIHVVTDSDEILIYELSDDSMDTGLPGRRPWTTILDLVEFAARAANPMHHQFVKERVLFHACDVAALDNYAEIVKRSDSLVDEILLRVRSGERLEKVGFGAMLCEALHAAAWAVYIGAKRAWLRNQRK